MMSTLSLTLFLIMQAAPRPLFNDPDEAVFKILGMFVPLAALFLVGMIVKSIISGMARPQEARPRTAEATPREVVVAPRPKCSYCSSKIPADAGANCPKCAAPL